MRITLDSGEVLDIDTNIIGFLRAISNTRNDMKRVQTQNKTLIRVNKTLNTRLDQLECKVCD